MSLRDDWMTESTTYIVHLCSAMLYKEEWTVSVPVVSIECNQESVIAQTPVDVGDDTSPISEYHDEDSRGRLWKLSEIRDIELLNNE